MSNRGGARRLVAVQDENVTLRARLKPTDVAVNENKPTKVLGKPMIKSPQNNRRPAFGEVGNRILAINNATKNGTGAVQKPGIMGPPVHLINKTNNNVNLIKKSAIVTKPTIIQPVLVRRKAIVRQESVSDRMLKECIKKANPEPGYALKQPIGVIDVDYKDSDPMLVSEYIKDIMKYLMSLENKYSIGPNFLDGHKSTPRIRSVLINWLNEVNANFKFVSETFHLAVAIVDRYLAKNPHVGRESLQLVGTAALLIAGKYEELFIPDINDYVFICDEAFSAKQMLRMECEILKSLNFSLGRPLSLHFLRRYNKIAKVNPLHHVLGKYILEVALLEYELCHIKPSLQAAAACFLALSLINETVDHTKVWNKLLVYYSRYTYADIKATVTEFAGALVKMETSKYQAIRKKYSSSSVSKISLSLKLKGVVIQKFSANAKILKK